MADDSKLHRAFKRIERDFERKAKAAVEREKELERQQVQHAVERDRRRRKLLDRLMLVGAVLFVCITLAAVCWARPELVSKSYRTITGLLRGGGKNSAPDCSDPEIARTTACLEKDRRRSEADWSGITMNSKGRENAFTLHRK